MSEEEKLLTGQTFNPNDHDLVRMKRNAHLLSQKFNQTLETNVAQRHIILSDLFGQIGEGTSFYGPIYVHYGKHTKIGNNCFFNFNITFQDDANITIGDDCRFGPGVTMVTPIHPLGANKRRNSYDENGTHFSCKAKPITIGHDCWFGANVTVCPGVKIGNNCVVGAGSVVTKDIPDNSLAYGCPARVVREIDENEDF